MIARARLTLVGLRINLAAGWRDLERPGSVLRWSLDAFLYRALRVRRFGAKRIRTIRFREGGSATYRLNRGDIRVVAETWMDRAYELPFEIPRPRLIVDLGANIGLTATWMAARYGCDRIIAVEPVADNAALARRNLADNFVQAEVHEAVIGPRAGTARFQDSKDSTEGRVSERGREVPIFTIPDLVGDASIGLLKVDIEGGEVDLIAGGPEWLAQVEVIVAEIHPNLVPSEPMLTALDQAGFEGTRLAETSPGRLGPEYTAVFRRPSPERRPG